MDDNVIKHIDNYHPASIKHEDKYRKDIMSLFGLLLVDLNDIKNLTDERIDKTISDWKRKYYDDLEDINDNHLNKLHILSNNVIKTDETKKEQDSILGALTTANMTMLDQNIEYLRQQFIQLKVLEDAYDYSDSMSDKHIQQTAKSLKDKIDLFATMSTIGNLRQLLFGNAESMGHEEYLWGCINDNKLRHSHEEMENRWIRFDDPNPQPLGLHVGMDYNCRCFIKGLR